MTEQPYSELVAAVKKTRMRVIVRCGCKVDADRQAKSLSRCGWTRVRVTGKRGGPWKVTASRDAEYLVT